MSMSAGRQKSEWRGPDETHRWHAASMSQEELVQWQAEGYEAASPFDDLLEKNELLFGALLRILALSEAGDERGHIANEALQGRVA